MDTPVIATAGPALGAGTSRTCPLCQMVADGSSETANGSWWCRRCGQRWDAMRLETAAAYAVYVAAHPVNLARASKPLVVQDDA